MRRGVVVARPRDAHVFRNGRLAFPPELERQDLGENLELDRDQAQDRGQRDGVLNEIAPDRGRQRFDGKRTELHAVRSGTGRDRVAVEQHRRARAHQLQVPIHRVLIQRHQDVELVAVSQDGLVTRAEGQEDVTAANDGLVGIVGVDVEPVADEDPRQNVAGSGNPLAGRAANADGEVDSLHGSSPVRALGRSNAGARRASRTARIRLPRYRRPAPENATTVVEGDSRQQPPRAEPRQSCAVRRLRSRSRRSRGGARWRARRSRGAAAARAAALGQRETAGGWVQPRAARSDSRSRAVAPSSTVQVRVSTTTP